MCWYTIESLYFYHGSSCEIRSSDARGEDPFLTLCAWGACSEYLGRCRILDAPMKTDDDWARSTVSMMASQQRHVKCDRQAYTFCIFVLGNNTIA